MTIPLAIVLYVTMGTAIAALGVGYLAGLIHGRILRDTAYQRGLVQGRRNPLGF